MVAERKFNGLTVKEFPIGPARLANPFAWLWEPLEEDPHFELKKLFGSPAIYLDGKLMIYFSMKPAPWRGLLLCTELEHHASLMSDFPVLKPHHRLGKWLFISESNDRFERTAEKIARLALYRDPRIGIILSAQKKRKGKGKRVKSTKQ
jgi:hypothetical protein